MLTLALLLLGCQQKPAGRDGYAGEPVRAAIHAGCSDALVDQADKPCVQIDVFAEGQGPQAARGEWVRVHYLVDVNGQQLDSSHDGKPLGFRLGQSRDVIEPAARRRGHAGRRATSRDRAAAARLSRAEDRRHPARRQLGVFGRADRAQRIAVILHAASAADGVFMARVWYPPAHVRTLPL